MPPRYQALRGTHDILPEAVGAWQRLERTTREMLGRYGFREIRTPIFEATELFTRSVGSSTDIVRKEMYTFGTGDESMTLRPENTAPVVRAFVEHSMHRAVATGFPERLYYIGPMFRHERPQKGRQRQFHQIGVEVLGGPEPQVDVETIDMIWALVGRLGITGPELRLNSVGDSDTRGRFREALGAWLAPHLPQMCDDCKRRAVENPLRVFDCKVEADQRRLAEAPSVLDHLSDESRRHFDEVRTGLERCGVPFIVDARLVRGLDYYQKTVFEIIASGLGAQNAIVGGGRYDGLVEELGGPSVPGFGFAAGMERMVLLMGAGDEASDRPDVAVIGLGETGFRRAVDLTRALRAEGLSVTSATVERPLGAQIKRAEKAGARYALFVGEGEIAKGRYGLKNLATGEQSEIEPSAIVAAVAPGRGRDGR